MHNTFFILKLKLVLRDSGLNVLDMLEGICFQLPNLYKAKISIMAA